jgi:hypothetical protein
MVNADLNDRVEPSKCVETLVVSARRVSRALGKPIATATHKTPEST